MLGQDGTLLGVVATSEATGMDKDAARTALMIWGLAWKTSDGSGRGLLDRDQTWTRWSSLGTQYPPLSSLVTEDNKGDGHQG